ncbi:MAG: hypothetical protein EOP07_16825 [Proteobacteria bacterium]|nr:MAG: hypothetical protein EOP07_16825 [Pseudomonadota bacterium]
MRKAEDSGQRTIETRLSCLELFPLLDELLGYFSSLRHRLYRDLIVNNLPLNDLKSSYLSSYGLTARHFNSLSKDVSARSKANEELLKLNLKKYESHILIVKNQCVDLRKKIKKNESLIKSIETYRSKVASWKLKKSCGNRILKRPAMPSSIFKLHKQNLLDEISRLYGQIHQKKRRLNNLTIKRDRLKARTISKLCFGSGKLFRAQFNLTANSFEDHQEWLNVFRLARSSSMTFVGSSDETCGNQTIQYSMADKALKMRLPNAKGFESKTLHMRDIVFPDFLKAEFAKALSHPGEHGKQNQKTALPITYRLIRRYNSSNKEKSYYLQASFKVAAAEIITHMNSGVVGVDINYDHLAITETDRFGNYLKSFVLPFNLKGLDREQAQAIIGDVVAVVVESCARLQKPLAIEDLDFAAKKSELRAQPKFRRHFLSQFAHASFISHFQSKARALGVNILSINPAYTSLIGAYKYQGLNISSHEKAALAIARRAQCYNEGLKVFQGTLPSQVMMTEKTKFRECLRHVWGFYADNRKTIRRLFIDADRRPLLPIRRASSLAGRHSSLKQSYLVIREKREFKEPSRSLG